MTALVAPIFTSDMRAMAEHFVREYKERWRDAEHFFATVREWPFLEGGGPLFPEINYPVLVVCTWCCGHRLACLECRRHFTDEVQGTTVCSEHPPKVSVGLVVCTKCFEYARLRIFAYKHGQGHAAGPRPPA